MLIIFMRNLSERSSPSIYLIFFSFSFLNGQSDKDGCGGPLARYGQVSRRLAHRCEPIYPRASFNQSIDVFSFYPARLRETIVPLRRGATPAGDIRQTREGFWEEAINTRFFSSSFFPFFFKEENSGAKDEWKLGRTMVHEFGYGIVNFHRRIAIFV